MNKEVVYIYTTEYYLAIRKDEILSFATTWMELESRMISEKSVRERQIPNDFTHMWNLRNKTKEQRKRESERA